MSLFTTLREFVLSLRGDAHNSHGGDSAASESETETEPTSEYLAVRAAGKRAAQYESDSDTRTHARDDNIVVIDDSGRWIEADSETTVEVDQ